MGLTTEITLPNGVKYTQPLGLFINNEFVQPKKEVLIPVINPATEEEITQIYGASKEDVDDAVKAARLLFESEEWSGIAAVERGDYLRKLADLIYRDRELLAAIDSLDNGKTYEDCLNGDMDEAYNVFKYYAGWSDKIFGKTIETSPLKLAYTVQEPLGVCGQIIPWNYPFMMLAWKIAPLVLCGNTVVLKSAEQTPLSALYFGNLVKEAGLPLGVINVISGYGRDAGLPLLEHMEVDKVAFTGSTVTGKLIMKAAAASNLKNVTLECGGKSPLIVFNDASLDQAVSWAHVGIFDNQGQVCTSTSRILVQEEIYDKFIELFVAYTKSKLVIGDPFDPKTIQGSQVSKQQYDKILEYIDIGKKEGAKVVYGGVKAKDKGYFIEPTIFTDCTQEMRIVQEEIFGPVVAVSKFKTVEEAVKKLNDTDYGLAAALFTTNITKAHKVALKLQAGMVWINSSQDSHFGIPFGGYKASGIGRELGSYALDAYTQTKAIHVNLGE